jgi:hypothetical protein
VYVLVVIWLITGRLRWSTGPRKQEDTIKWWLLTACWLAADTKPTHTICLLFVRLCSHTGRNQELVCLCVYALVCNVTTLPAGGRNRSRAHTQSHTTMIRSARLSFPMRPRELPPLPLPLLQPLLLIFLLLLLLALVALFVCVYVCGCVCVNVRKGKKKERTKQVIDDTVSRE